MQKLSRAESGKLGGAKSKAITEAKKQARIAQYNLAPAVCKHCGKELQYADRKKSFCNRSCAALFNNAARKELVTWHCASCNKEHIGTPGAIGIYCNNQCRADNAKEETFRKFTAGLLSDRGMIKSTLVWKQGHQCSNCKLSEWMGEKIPLEVDHIDGNAGNNDPTNIRLLCPNCHGLTPTWKGRNKGFGRSSRGLPLG